MCPRNPVTWETHAYFSHLRRFIGRTDSHYVHINKLEVFLLCLCASVCVFPPPAPFHLILAIVLFPPVSLPEGFRDAFSSCFSLDCHINVHVEKGQCVESPSPLKSHRETVTSYSTGWLSLINTPSSPNCALSNKQCRVGSTTHTRMPPSATK